MRLRRKRMVRAHLRDADHSIEGILVERSRGHYGLASARLIEAPEVSHPVGLVWIPRERVLFLQVLS